MIYGLFQNAVHLTATLNLYANLNKIFDICFDYLKFVISFEKNIVNLILQEPVTSMSMAPKASQHI